MIYGDALTWRHGAFTNMSWWFSMELHQEKYGSEPKKHWDFTKNLDRTWIIWTLEKWWKVMTQQIMFSMKIPMFFPN